MTTNVLHRLLTIQEITDQLTRYARAADRVDLPLLQSVFWPDAALDYGDMFQGSSAEFVSFIGQVHPGMLHHAHHLGNVLVDVRDDEAGSETYVRTWIRFPSPDGAGLDLHSTGRYVDRWEHRDGVWRIIHRQYLHGMDETRVVAKGEVSSVPRDSSDPSYAALGS